MILALSDTAWSAIATVFSVVVTAALRTWHQNRVETRQNEKVVEQAEAVKSEVKATVLDAAQAQKEAVRTSATRLSAAVENVQENVNGRLTALMDSNTELAKANSELAQEVNMLKGVIVKLTGDTPSTPKTP